MRKPIMMGGKKGYVCRGREESNPWLDVLPRKSKNKTGTTSTGSFL